MARIKLSPDFKKAITALSHKEKDKLLFRLLPKEEMLVAQLEFQLLEDGFQLIDEQTQQNSGFYAYEELQSVELDKAWFPRLAQWMRATT